jgi:hypothetical protein
MANNFVPNAPLTSFTEAQFLIAPNTNLSFLNDKPSGNSSGAPKPSIKSLSKIKSTLLRPALTSHFECYFNPPDDVRKYLADNRQFNYNSDTTELITLSCSEASLPGSSLLTNEVNDDYTGVTERLAYRRQYDDRADFTFYVDHGRNDGNYNIIWFFENWISYIANEQFNQGLEGNAFNYRFNFPDGTGEPGKGYRSSALYINKFERDMQGSYLSYRFIKAYPIAINSMPVTYESSELLKCTVSFTYTRYVVNRLQGNPSPQIKNSVSEYSNVFSTNSSSGGQIPGTTVVTNEYYNNFGSNKQNATNTADFFGVG